MATWYAELTILIGLLLIIGSVDAFHFLALFHKPQECPPLSLRQRLHHPIHFHFEL